DRDANEMYDGQRQPDGDSRRRCVGRRRGHPQDDEDENGRQDDLNGQGAADADADHRQAAIAVARRPSPPESTRSAMPAGDGTPPRVAVSPGGAGHAYPSSPAVSAASPEEGGCLSTTPAGFAGHPPGLTQDIDTGSRLVTGLTLRPTTGPRLRLRPQDRGLALVRAAGDANDACRSGLRFLDRYPCRWSGLPRRWVDAQHRVQFRDGHDVPDAFRRHRDPQLGAEYGGPLVS